MVEERQRDKKNSLDSKTRKTMKEQNEKLFTVFDLEGEEYGISVDMMDEIVRDVDISRIPGSPENVLGATNLRGEVIPVIDLKNLLSLGRTSDEVQDTMIVQMKEQKFAAPVDRLKDIVSTKKEQLVDPSNITNLDDEKLKWIIRLEGTRSIRVVNIRKLAKEVGNLDIQTDK